MIAEGFPKMLKYIVVVFMAWSVNLSADHVDFRPAGWLDRVVLYHKQRFFDDVQKRLPPIGFSAKMMKAPEGYVDSKQWDYESVIRLFTLLRASEKTRPLFRSLRRTLSSTVDTRRLYGMSQADSRNIFPNIDQANYYDDDSLEAKFGEGADNVVNNRDQDASDEEDVIVVISNPAEAKLPVSHISVRVLREILEARAMNARAMPNTTTEAWDLDDFDAKTAEASTTTEAATTKAAEITTPTTEATTAPAG